MQSCQSCQCWCLEFSGLACASTRIMTTVKLGRKGKRGPSVFACLFFEIQKIFYRSTLSRLPIIFRWPELSLMVSCISKGDWEHGKWAGPDWFRPLVIDCLRLEIWVHGSKSEICYQERRDGINPGPTMNKACHKWFTSTIKRLSASSQDSDGSFTLCAIDSRWRIVWWRSFVQSLLYFFSDHTISR